MAPKRGLLSAVIFAGVTVVYADRALAATVAISVLAAGTIAKTVGLAGPRLLNNAGLDPAFGSGPLATVIQDVLSILIYLACASAIMM